MPELERIPPNEAELIESIVKNTAMQMKKRYSGESVVRRGVHPKDHGCAMARFKVNDSLPEHLRVGVLRPVRMAARMPGIDNRYRVS